MAETIPHPEIRLRNTCVQINYRSVQVEKSGTQARKSASAPQLVSVDMRPSVLFQVPVPALPPTHAISHLQLGRPAMELVHEPRVAAKPLVAVPRLVVLFLRCPLLLGQEGQTMLAILVEVCGGFLHGGELARTLLLGRLAAVGIAGLRRAVGLPRGAAVARVVVVPARFVGAAIVESVGVFVVSS